MLTFQAEVVEPEPVPVQEEVAAYSEVLPYFLTLTLLTLSCFSYCKPQNKYADPKYIYMLEGV